MSDRREEIQSRMNMGGGYLSGTCMNEQHMIHVGADVRYLQEQLAEAEARAEEAERLLRDAFEMLTYMAPRDSHGIIPPNQEFAERYDAIRAFLTRNAPEERK